MKIENLPEVASDGAVFTIDGVEHVFFRYEPVDGDYYCAHCPYNHRGLLECVPCNEAKGSAHYGVMPLTMFVTRALDKD